MTVRLHPHAKARLKERGATKEEIIAAVERGERFDARFGRVGFRRNFRFESTWRGRFYATNQGEAIAVEEDGWLVITAIVRFF